MAATDKISSFDLKSVRLSDSRFSRQYAHTHDYYLAIPNDDILYGFRQRAGLPNPGKPMGGWYHTEDGGYSHTFGQWLSAFARMASLDTDKAMKDKVLSLMREWGKTIDPDGFFGGVSCGGTNFISHYMYEKVVGGLVDIAKYLHEPEALQYLDIVIDWGAKHLTYQRNTASAYRCTGETDRNYDSEWYTLSENIYRAYEIAGNEAYKEFAQRWHYTAFWQDLAKGKDVFPYKHAYSHVNTLSSAAMAYRISEDPQYLKTITNAYDILRDHHTYVTGGYGPRESFFSEPGAMSRTLWDNVGWEKIPANFENPCGSWAGFKLSRYLTEFTGLAKYGDWIELLLYNGIGAALPMAGYGQTYYYCDYTLRGGSKAYCTALWPCCSGTYPQAVTEYHNLIYYKDANGLYVNLFVPSQVTWEQSGQEVKIIQETSFPESEQVSLKIQVANKTSFALRFRVPGWVRQSISVKINDERVNVNATPETWASLDREWQNGDTVEITLPMDLDFIPIDRVDVNRVALRYGPVVLVNSQLADFQADKGAPSAWIKPADRPLQFVAQSSKGPAIFEPYFLKAEGEKYFMYVRVLN
jgi:DUF1680 family protein